MSGFFVFDGNEWCRCSPDTELEEPTPATLKLATLNILADSFPWFVRAATPPAARIRGIIARINALAPDILGLNEVTPSLLKEILADDDIRRHYFVTEVPGTVKEPHGCMLLTRHRPTRAFHLEGSSATPDDADSGRVGVAVEVAGLVVCSLHTMAYQRADTRAIRERQVRHVSNTLRSGGKPFVIMGDLNMHDLAEDAIVVDNALLDCWAETHPRFTAGRDMATDEPDAGFTFDARRNGMIPRYIPGERRRMRLDRILAQRGLPWEPAAPCALWADEPVDASRDVWCSDHFGLVVTLRRSAGWNGDPSVRAAHNDNRHVPTTEHTLHWLSFGVNVACHSLWLALRVIGAR